MPTSPRSPYKLPNELALLAAHFDGRPWNPATQSEYMARLSQSEFYEGEGSARYPDFAARDRINRAPRMFGFIRLERRQPLRLLPAGRRLIASRDATSPDFDLFLHQLLKWQYLSPSHQEPDYRELFAVKPFLECLRLIRDLGYLTKVELAIFGVPLIDYREYGGVCDAVLSYRRGLTAQGSKGQRNEFAAETARQHFRRIYRDDIRAGRIGTREEGGASQSVDEFVDKKIRNARDYADAAMRYFRATGLFYVRASPFHYHLRLLEERAAEIDRILETTSRAPRPFDDLEAYSRYLGDPDQPRLPDEEPVVLRRRIRDLYEAAPPRRRGSSKTTWRRRGLWCARPS